LLDSRTHCHGRPDFRALHHDGVRNSPRGVNRRGEPAALLGFLPLQGFTRAGPGTAASSRPPPMHLTEPPLRSSTRDNRLRGFRRCFGVSLGPDAGAAALAAASTLLRFPTSSTFSQVWMPTCPGSWFHLRVRATSPRSVDPSSGRWGLLPESREEAVSVAEFVTREFRSSPEVAPGGSYPEPDPEGLQRPGQLS
jgi:hypothetical protein